MGALKVCAVSKRRIALIAATYTDQVHFQSVRSATHKPSQKVQLSFSSL